MRIAVSLSSLLLAAGASGATWADTLGVVRDADGRGIAHVTITAGSTEVVTGSSGTFRLVGVSPPIDILCRKAGYLDLELRVEQSPVTIQLEAMAAIADDIAVEATLGARERFAPAGIASTVLTGADRPAAPANLTDLVLAAPGVAENGQGGLFQVVSIRGVSRQRVLTRVAGIPVVAERRAGASTSFVDPDLLGDVAVVRGPVGVLYGTGVLGGVIEVWPRSETALRFAIGWREGNDELSSSFGGRLGEWSLAAAHRRADDDQAADGSRLYSGFEQTSMSLQGLFGELRPVRLTAIASFGSDIAKPNTLFPREATTYPEERHLAVRLAGELTPTWSWAVHAHPNDLATETTTATTRERVTNEALDFGARSSRSWALGASSEWTLSGEWFARRDARALEEIATCAAGTLHGLPAPTACEVEARGATLDRAALDEFSIASTWERRFARASVHLGARGVWERQDDRGVAATEADAVVAFIGANLALGGGFEASANVGTGARLASLSERLYSGLTGAGRIVGNPELEPERSQNLEVGLRHLSRLGLVSVHLFRSDIDDFIERVEIDDGLFTYRNLASGTMEGAEVEALASWNRWRLESSWLHLRGTTSDGRTLPDVPADRTRMLVGWRSDHLDLSAEWIHRFAKDTFGSGEVARGASDGVAAQISVPIGPTMWVSLAGENLLDELWFPSADRRASPGPGRTVKLTLRWQRR